MDGNIFWDLWKAIEDHVGIIEQGVALRIVNDNYDLEVSLSDIDEQEKKMLIVSFDMGWQKRSTGRSYNSLSGQAFLIGTKTGKVIAMLVKAKICCICASAENKNRVPTQHDCTSNHEGSSKGMEAEAAVELLTLAYSKGTPVTGLIGDDDGTFRAHCKHPIQDKIDAGILAPTDWPRHKSTGFKINGDP